MNRPSDPAKYRVDQSEYQWEEYLQYLEKELKLASAQLVLIAALREADE